MPAKRFLRHVNGFPQEVIGTQMSTGATSAGDIVALDDTGKLDSSLLPTGIGADVAVINATEALAAGAFVNLWNNAGTPGARNADASGGTAKMAHGFVLAAFASGSPATVYFEGTNTQVSGQTGGTNVYLSATTPGAATATIPSGAGYIVQALGTAISSSAINAEIQKQPIVLAA